jgi:hypothetical protein
VPYKVEKKGDQWCVINADTGEEKACHATEEDAERQKRLLLAIENDPSVKPREG